jgi:protoporphyrinogen oxidase
VVSTLPLTTTVKLLGENVSAEARNAAEELRFRHIRLVFIRLARASVSANASIYIPQPEFCISRVDEPRNRSAAMAPDGETSLVAEVPCFSGDAMQQLGDEALAARAIEELDKIGIIARGEVLEWKHHVLANAYPVHTMEYASKVVTRRNALSHFTNLDTIGCAGAFVYSHLHDQLRFGRDYVESFQRPNADRIA